MPAARLQVGPGIVSQQGGVDHDCLKAHAQDVLGGRGRPEQLRSPTDRPDPLGKHAHEAAVGVDQGHPRDGRHRAGMFSVRLVRRSEPSGSTLLVLHCG